MGRIVTWYGKLRLWGSKLSTMDVHALYAEIDNALAEVCGKTARQITYKIMYAADKYIDLALRGVLV